MIAPVKRKLTADEYQRMGQTGIIGSEERVELLDGEIYTMAPIGDDHIGSVNSLNYFLPQRLAGQVIVSVQNPIRLSDYSEPEPDIALLRFRPDFYGTAKARPDDVLLLIEVAHSSLDFDRLSKLPRYAEAGIPEVWIVNLVEHVVEVYREPRGDRYTAARVYQRGESLSPSALPDVLLQVEEITG